MCPLTNHQPELDRLEVESAAFKALRAFTRHFEPLRYVDTPHPEVVRAFELADVAMKKAGV